MTTEKRRVKTFKYKEEWFPFQMSFVLTQSYAYTCAHVDASVAHFAVVNEPFILMLVVMLVSCKNQALLLVLQNIQCFIVYTFLFISSFFSCSERKKR